MLCIEAGDKSRASLYYNHDLVGYAEVVGKDAETGEWCKIVIPVEMLLEFSGNVINSAGLHAPHECREKGNRYGAVQVQYPTTPESMSHHPLDRTKD